MAKPSKKAQPRVVKPITDFFQRIPSSSQVSSVSDSASNQPRLKGEAASKHPGSPATSLTKHNGNRALKSSSASNSRVESSPHRPISISPRKPMESQRIKSTMPRTASLKRPRSPEVPKASISEGKQTEAQAAQSSQPNKSSPRKKPRLSSSPTSSFVPSSQSDEDELPTPRTNSPSKSAAKEHVKQWRKNTLPPTPDPVASSASSGSLSVDMDVDGPSYAADTRTPTASEQEISAQLNDSPRTSTSGPSRILTPPYTDRSSDDLPVLPPTPVALTAEEKTAQILKQIKARALAAVQSSPEYTTMEIPELDDSDDEDDLLIQPLNLVTSRPNPVASSSGPTLRRSSRQRHSLSGTSEGSPVSRHSRLSPAERALSSDDELPQSRGKPRVRPNPIEVLLKEKEKAEKGGKGSVAFPTAESSLIGKGLLLEEMSLEDMDEELDYDNLKNTDSPLPLASYKPSDDLFLDEEDGKKFFGDEGGKGINTILRGDAKAMQAEAEVVLKTTEGVSLWCSGGNGDSMMIDEQPLSIPTFASGTNSPTLQMIDQALQQRDFAKATWLLKSRALSNLAVADNSNVIAALCTLATSAKLFESPISEVAFSVAMDLLENGSTGKAPVSPSFVNRAMLELGARVESFENAQVKFESVPRVPVDASQRANILYRVAALASKVAVAKRFSAQDVPDLVVSLALVAMDTSNPVQLRREVGSTINHVCQVDKGLESIIASRLVSLAESFKAVNKAFLVSIFASGNGATMRIARFTAYCMIVATPSHSVTSKTYCDPPPLPRLLNLFIANDKDAMDHLQISPFAINNDTDYTTMKFFVYLFSIAASDIKSYVWDERNKERAAQKAFGRFSSSSKEKKPETDLQLLHYLLEEFHASINDLRAAHLDRSRVKAAVKQLQMRIYYQRCAFERAWRDQNLPKANLNHWIKGKPTKVGP